jgi:hypothetical protein
VNRRRALELILLAAGSTLLGGHTPYGQWVVYRQKHLLIGCHREDAETYRLAKDIVAALEIHLPSAEPRVARGPTAGRIASLLGTGQMEVAVLTWADAVGMLNGAEPFAPYGAIEIRLIAPVAAHVLISRVDLPNRHAWLIAHGLRDGGLAALPLWLQAYPVPWHPGSRAFFRGEPEPEAAPEGAAAEAPAE